MKTNQSCSTRRRGVASGFTLLESLIASGIVGLIFLSLYSGMTYGFSTIRMSRENLRATQIMTEMMEVIRLYTWSQVNDNKTIPKTFTASYYPAGGTNGQGVTYNGQIEIKDVSFNTNYKNAMQQVTVTLSWTTGKVARTRTLVTYVAQYGLQNYIF